MDDRLRSAELDLLVSRDRRRSTIDLSTAIGFRLHLDLFSLGLLDLFLHGFAASGRSEPAASRRFRFAAATAAVVALVATVRCPLGFGRGRFGDGLSSGGLSITVAGCSRLGSSSLQRGQ